MLPLYDPLLLEAGMLVETKCDIIGVETNFDDETVLFKKEVFMFLDVQPSRRGWSYFRFKILGEQFIYVEATVAEFKNWFSLVYRPDWIR